MTRPALPAPVRVPLGVVALGAALAVAVLGVLFAGATAGTALDGSVRDALAGASAPWPQLALVVDYPAEPVGGALTLGVLVLVCLRLGHRRAAVLAVVGPGGSVACTTLLKPVVGREINGGFLAFPSGHTAAATAVALVGALVFVRRRRLRATAGVLVLAAVTVPAAAAMAWAQVLLNAHYLTDTAGGFCTALAVVPAAAWAVDRVADRR